MVGFVGVTEPVGSPPVAAHAMSVGVGAETIWIFAGSSMRMHAGSALGVADEQPSRTFAAHVPVGDPHAHSPQARVSIASP